MPNVTLSLGFATAAAMSALSGTAIAAPAASHDAAAGDQVVHCYGVNTCKGTSDCATKANACKGQNECKGQGFKALSVTGCATAGGTTTAPAN